MNRQEYCTPPRWWPPRLNRAIVAGTRGIRRRRMQLFGKFSHVAVKGLDRLQEVVNADCGLMITANHSEHYDSEAIYAALDKINTPTYIMTAWQIFGNCSWWQQQLVAGIGCFSVNREGSDRAALKQAIAILRKEKYPLLIFPEGDIYHTNDRIRSFRDGMGAIAMSAARKATRPVKIMPSTMKFWYIQDPRPSLRKVLTRLESRLVLRPERKWPLLNRVARLGEAALTIKEIEYLGDRNDDCLGNRLQFLINHILNSLEERYGGLPEEHRIPDRVQALRQTIIPLIDAEKSLSENARMDFLSQCELGMEDLFTVIQLYSYPADYLDGDPSIERIAETVIKLEEDIEQPRLATLHGRRMVDIRFGEPITVEQTKSKDAAPMLALTENVRREMQSLIDESIKERPAHAVG